MRAALSPMHREGQVPILIKHYLRDGWKARPGGNHDVYKHPTRPGRIILPRHRTPSPGVARAVAKHAGWLD